MPTTTPWWSSLSSIAAATIGSPKALAQAPIPTLVVMIVEEPLA
jgi:hypothetical protein